jgi:acyl carrier protein phosphodiesterase
MNYLAHFALAHPQGLARLGGLIGDFLKGDVVGIYPRDIEIEIILHRRIDSWTDRHELPRKIKRLFPEKQRRFVPILLDIYWDYLLMRHWDLAARGPFEAFAEETYNMLLRHRDLLPDDLRGSIDAMVNARFLHSCRDMDGMVRSVERLARRWRYGEHLIAALPTLRNLPGEVEAAFPAFFRELGDYVTNERAALAEVPA